MSLGEQGYFNSIKAGSYVHKGENTLDYLEGTSNVEISLPKLLYMETMIGWH